MMLQQQLGNPQQQRISEAAVLHLHGSIDFGLLGNQSGQTPSQAAVKVYSYDDLIRSASQRAFKLAFIKQQKFTVEGRTQRIAASLAALNAQQPTELSLAAWKEIVEEVEDEQD